MESFVLIAVVVVGLGLFFSYLSSKAKEQRQREFASFAKRHGFQFHVAEPPGCGTFGFGPRRVFGDPVGVIDYASGFEPFGRGHGQAVENMVWGDEASCRWYLCDYRYSSGSGDDERTYSYGVVIAELPVLLPQMRIREQGFFDGVGSLLGAKDIQFESDDFNRRFWIVSDDSKRAYEVIHPQMMEYLMSLPVRDLQIYGNWIVWHESGTLSIHEFERVMQDIQGFHQRIPPYYKQDHATEVGNWITQG